MANRRPFLRILVLVFVIAIALVVVAALVRAARGTTRAGTSSWPPAALDGVVRHDPIRPAAAPDLIVASRFQGR